MLRKRFMILIILAVLIFMYIFVIVDRSQNVKDNKKLDLTNSVDSVSYEVVKNETEKLKYILQWTSPKRVPFVYMGVGQQGFKDHNCSYTNCYVTNDRNLLHDYTKFDVIAFAGPEIVKYTKSMLPERRSAHQKYVFASIESAANYPSCQTYLNDFFNWTWTYKLDSDSRWGYIVIRDKNEKIIGPNKIMHWMKPEEMQPVPDKLKEILLKKKKAAAWFVSNCHSISKREVFVDKLASILKSNYNLDVDIYGRCKKLSCPRDDEKACDEMVRKDYYFYLAFENSFSEDYVTEKLLHALEFNAIPIVFGGANYSRFLPEGSYLNARELGEEKLAAKMYELIANKDQYIKFFKWTNHYRYHRRNVMAETNDYCSMCALLNNESKVKQTSIYKDFNSWWNSGSQISC